MLHNYIWPVTSRRSAPQRAKLTRLLQGMLDVRVGPLAVRAQQRFQWTPDATVQRFQRLIVPGLVFRGIHADAMATGHRSAEPAPQETASSVATRLPLTPPRRRRALPAHSPVSRITDYFSAVSTHSPERRARLADYHATRIVGTRTEARVSYDAHAYLHEVSAAVGGVLPLGAAMQRMWLPVAALLAQPGGEQLRVRAFLAAQQRKASSPTKRSKQGPHQAVLTSYFVSGKGGARTTKTDTQAHELRKSPSARSHGDTASVTSASTCESPWPSPTARRIDGASLHLPKRSADNHVHQHALHPSDPFEAPLATPPPHKIPWLTTARLHDDAPRAPHSRSPSPDTSDSVQLVRIVSPDVVVISDTSW